MLRRKPVTEQGGLPRRDTEERVRELERLLGRKTMEVVILKEGLDLARVKRPTLLSRSQPPEDTR
jgi:transposase